MVNFTNIINQALYSLIKTEVGNYPIIFDDEFNPADLAFKNEYIRIGFLGDQSIENLANINVRNYNYQIVYYLQHAGKQKKSILENRISERKETLYDLLMNNRYYFNETYKWTHIEINSIIIMRGEERTTNRSIVSAINLAEQDIYVIDFDVSITRTNEFEQNPVILTEDVILV